MINTKLILLILLIISSCSQRAKCKRIINRANKNGCITYNSDTIILKDTIIGWQYDTNFIGKNLIDTFTLVKENIKIKTIVNWKDRYINQSVMADTIFITKTIIKTVPKITKFPFWKKYFFVFILIFLLILFSYLSRK